MSSRRAGSRGFAIAAGDLVVILGDGVGFQVRQLSQLGLAEAMVAQAFDDAPEFGTESQCPVRGAQRTGSRRRLSAGNDVARIADLETAVGVFRDLHVHTGVAGTLGAGQQLQGPPLVLDRVVPGNFAGVLEAEGFVQGALEVQGTVGRLRQFGRGGELGVVAGQEVLQDGAGLVDGFGVR